jgi:protein-disulfide isomerase
MLAKVKDHPQLKDRSDAEKEKMIRDHLGGKAKGEAIQGILTAARKRGELVMMYPEPVFEIVIKSTDPVRYGPKPGDTKPMGCEGNACPITLVEYSEYQCPFCSRVTPALERLLTEYKGKIRHIVRDFPLEFHDQARPAAVAARCAQDQGKFWFMYKGLFEKQQSLGQETYETVAKNIGLDMAKFKDCMKNPDAKLAIVDANQQSGMKAGVTGTPCYFVNGQRLSGALPFEDFKRAADAELAKAKR